MLSVLLVWVPFLQVKVPLLHSCSLHPILDLYLKGQYLQKNFMNIIFNFSPINCIWSRTNFYFILLFLFLYPSLFVPFPHLSFHPHLFLSESLPPTLIHFLLIERNIKEMLSKRQQDKTGKYIYGVGWNTQHSYRDCLYSLYTLMSVSQDIYLGDF